MVELAKATCMVLLVYETVLLVCVHLLVCSRQ